MALQFAVAGALRLVHAGARIEDRAFGGPQPRLVAAMLLVDRHRDWAPEELAAQLWPHGPPTRWRPAVRALVSRIRGLLTEIGVEGSAVSSRSGSYRVELPELAVDLEVARSQVARAALAVEERRLDTAGDLAGRARAVLSRPILTGQDAPWVEELRRIVESDHVECLLLLAAARGGQGRWAAARSALHEALDRAPFREDAWRSLMEVEAEAGNVARALQVYEQCRHQLAEELGVDPSPGTQALHESLLRGVPATSGEGAVPGRVAGRAVPERARAPYVGLRTFQEADADRFFGRDAAVQRLVDLLVAHRAVVVVGPSGSGKSSLVRAGLLPALASGAIPDSDTWPAAVVVPGRRPLRSLARALAGVAGETATAGAGEDLAARLALDPDALGVEVGRVLADVGADPAAVLTLVLDQAEERFTVAEPAQSAALLEAIAVAVRGSHPRVAVVATMRADFYARAATDPDMAALLGRAQLVVPPMSGAEVEAAVVGPANLVGARLEPGIVGRIVDDATGSPGGLPLLQHTLWELWRTREEATLTVEGYERIGGLAGALARHAEECWARVGDTALARRVLLRGVTPGGREDSDTRRPIHRADLVGVAPPDDVEGVLEHLVSGRLLQAESREGDVVYEIAHEALISAWPRLHRWVDEQRAHLVAARALGTAADRWAAADRDPGWLLRGRSLTDAVAVREAVESGVLDLALSPDELALVSCSVEAREWERAQRRVERGLAAARLHLADDPEAALLIALELVDELERVPERRQELASVLHRGVHRHRLVRRGEGVGALLAVSPDGRLMAVAGPTSTPGAPGSDHGSGTVRLHRVADGELVARLGGHAPDPVPRAVFNPEGTRLVSGDGAGKVRTWCVATGELEATWAAARGPVGGLDVAAGSGLVAAWAAIGHDREVVVLTADGRRVHEIPPDGAAAFEEDVPRPGRLVAFRPDGRRLLVACAEVARRIDLLEVGSWRVLASASRPRPRHPTLNFYREVTSLEWDRGGRHVAVAVGAATRILDGETLETVTSARSDTRGSVAWTPDGARVATAGRSVSFLDVRPPDPDRDTPTPPVEIRPTSPSADRLRVRALPHGDLLVLGSERTASVDLHDHSVDGPAEVVNLRPMAAQGISWSPDGTRLALGRGDGVVSVVDTDGWQEVERYRAHRHDGDHDWPRVDGPVVWSRDGRFLASTASDGTLAIRHLPEGTTRTVRVGEPSNWPGDCDITPDSRYVAAVAPGRASMVSADGSVVATRVLPAHHLGSSRLSADGSLLATPWRGDRGRSVTDTWTTELWDWSSDEPPRILGPAGVSHGESLSFSPDGRTLALGADDPVVRIVDADDGRVLHELVGHEVQVAEVVHHPDGHLLASSGWDGTVRVWDLHSRQQVAVFEALTGQPGTMAFHPTRPWLAVADWSGVVRVWTLDLAELVTIARGRVTRAITDVERRLLSD